MQAASMTDMATTEIESERAYGSTLENEDAQEQISDAMREFQKLYHRLLIEEEMAVDLVATGEFIARRRMIGVAEDELGGEDG
jgi:predicted nucleotidyltransferase